MVTIFGKNYYLDLDAVTEQCRIIGSDEIEEDDDLETTSDGGSVNIFKYEILKMCVERVLGEYETDDDDSIFGADKLSPSFKLAFNTLIKNDILIEEGNYE